MDKRKTTLAAGAATNVRTPRNTKKTVSQPAQPPPAPSPAMPKTSMPAARKPSPRVRSVRFQAMPRLELREKSENCHIPHKRAVADSKMRLPKEKENHTTHKRTARPAKEATKQSVNFPPAKRVFRDLVPLGQAAARGHPRIEPAAAASVTRVAAAGTDLTAKPKRFRKKKTTSEHIFQYEPKQIGAKVERAYQPGKVYKKLPA